MAGLVIRIKSSDFSEFAGFHNTNKDYTENNEDLNAYIDLYKRNDDIRFFQIECDRSMPMHTIAYICHRMQEKYFIKVDFEEDVKAYRYWLCFYKENMMREEETQDA